MGASLGAAGRVLRHVGQLFLLRADLAAEELALARRQYVGWLATVLAAFALLIVALVAGGAWLTLVLWHRLGVATPALLALLFGVAAVLLLRSVMTAATFSPAPLARTRAALADDYHALAAVAGPQAAGGPDE